jgi:hypothetical protein
MKISAPEKFRVSSFKFRVFRCYTKFCFQYNKLKFQFADNPGLFNRKPKTDNRKRYNASPHKGKNVGQPPSAVPPPPAVHIYVKATALHFPVFTSIHYQDSPSFSLPRGGGQTAVEGAVVPGAGVKIRRGAHRVAGKTGFLQAKT